MLPAALRLTNPDDFRAVVRGGVRSGRGAVVVHARRTEGPATRAGFLVTKSVGNAVTRNRVKRRLRHLTAGTLAGITAPVDVVVRALPASAERRPAELRSDFGEAWAAALAKLGSR